MHLLRQITTPRLREIADQVVAFPGASFSVMGSSSQIVFFTLPNGEEIRLFMDDITARVVSFTSSGVVTSEASFSSRVSARLVAAYITGYIVEGA